MLDAAELLLAGLEDFLLEDASDASTFTFLDLAGGPILTAGLLSSSLTTVGLISLVGCSFSAGFSFSAFFVSLVLALLQSSFPVAFGFEAVGGVDFVSTLTSFSSFLTLSLGSSLILEEDAADARPGFLETIKEDFPLAVWTFPI